MKRLNGISDFDIRNFKLSTLEELKQKSVYELKLYITELEDCWQNMKVL